jgi:hypothetical protein
MNWLRFSILDTPPKCQCQKPAGGSRLNSGATLRESPRPAGPMAPPSSSALEGVRLCRKRCRSKGRVLRQSRRHAWVGCSKAHRPRTARRSTCRQQRPVGGLSRSGLDRLGKPPFPRAGQSARPFDHPPRRACFLPISSSSHIWPRPRHGCGESPCCRRTCAATPYAIRNSDCR